MTTFLTTSILVCLHIVPGSTLPVTLFAYNMTGTQTVPVILKACADLLNNTALYA